MKTRAVSGAGVTLALLVVLVCCTGQTCQSDSADREVAPPTGAASSFGIDAPNIVDPNMVDPNGVDPNTLAFTVEPDDLTLDCMGDDNAAVLAAWLGSADATAPDGCAPVMITNDYDETFDTCGAAADWSTTVTWTATDGCGSSIGVSAMLTIVSPDAPFITLNGDVEVVLERGVDTYDELGAVATFGCGIGEVEATVGGDAVDDEVAGTYLVTYDATDPCGNSADTVTRTVLVVNPPLFTFVPEDFLLDCESPGDAGMPLDDWLNSATAEADPACGDATVTSEIVGLAEMCDEDGWSFEVMWTAEDECGLVETASATLVLQDPFMPMISLNGDATVEVECNDEYGELGATVLFDCIDMDVPATVDGDVVDVATPGTYVVTYELADECGHGTDVLMRTVHVVDTAPPDLTLSGETELWPPNHSYHRFSLEDCVVSAFDVCEGELDVSTMGMILSISSDEIENGTGDGNTIDDIVIVDQTTFMLRAERAGGGNGRVYLVQFEVVDSEGNASMGACRFAVPHDQSGASAVDDGAAYEVLP